MKRLAARLHTWNCPAAVARSSLDKCLLRPQTSCMTWTEPQYEEISLGCEINSYASAEV